MSSILYNVLRDRYVTVTLSLLDIRVTDGDQGAATTVWALVEPSLGGRRGLYLQRCKIADILDQPNYRTGVMRYAVDPDLADRLSATIGRQLPL